MSILFISDLHLDAARPEIGDQLLAFLDSRGRTAERLYILGDLFESWVGDDDPQPERARVVDALYRVSDAGTDCFFMRGNRDFLIGKRFADEAGLTLLDDELVLELYGQRLLLLHGDSLCTDDHEYQSFRTMVRDPRWQDNFLAMPLEQRLAMANEARARSREHNANSTDAIMDVNAAAVASALRRHDVHLMLHGHTHRPAEHETQLDGARTRRIVLGDWYEQGSLVEWDNNGLRLEFLPRNSC